MKRTPSLTSYLALACVLILGLASGAVALPHRIYTCPGLPEGDSQSLWDGLSYKPCSNYIATMDTTGSEGTSGPGTCCQLCGCGVSSRAALPLPRRSALGGVPSGGGPASPKGTDFGLCLCP